MIATGRSAQKKFKMWMAATLGLLKDGKMGVSRARAERIKAALSYARKGGVELS